QGFGFRQAADERPHFVRACEAALRQSLLEPFLRAAVLAKGGRQPFVGGGEGHFGFPQGDRSPFVLLPRRRQGLARPPPFILRLPHPFVRGHASGQLPEPSRQRIPVLFRGRKPRAQFRKAQLQAALLPFQLPDAPFRIRKPGRRRVQRFPRRIRPLRRFPGRLRLFFHAIVGNAGEILPPCVKQRFEFLFGQRQPASGFLAELPEQRRGVRGLRGFAQGGGGVADPSVDGLREAFQPGGESLPPRPGFTAGEPIRRRGFRRCRHGIPRSRRFFPRGGRF